MTIVDTLVTECNRWTKRPDLDAATRAAIRGVTLKYHRMQKLFKDLATVLVPNPDVTQQVAQIDIPTFFPQWRQFKSIKNDGSDKSYTVADPNQLLDLDGYSLLDVYLVAGTTLNVKSGGGFQNLNVIYYKDPIIATDATYNSWIATEQQDLIVCAAAVRVLSFDNESDIAKIALAEEKAQAATFFASNLEEQGR